jgi:hypothetical protein
MGKNKRKEKVEDFKWKTQRRVNTVVIIKEEVFG